MKTIQLKAAARAEYGKKAAKAARREGLIPCVIYGGGENVAFAIDAKAVKPLIYTPNSYIDFYRVQEGKPVSIAVPVRLSGTAEGVKVGGKLALSARKLVVSALVENLPDELVVDVTPLNVGQTIFVGDLKFDNLQFVSPATQAVCAVRVTRASRGAEAANA